MKKIFLKILVFIFKIFSSFFILFPIKKKITIFTRLNNLTIDVKELYKELTTEFKDYKVIILKDKFENNKLKYIKELPSQVYNIYTSQLVITDSYIPAISISFKKKNVKIIQIWHAMGAYKKFGYSILDKKEGSKSFIADVTNMHKNYDYVLCTSKFAKEKYKEAFNVSGSSIKIVLPPRYNYLKQNELEIKREIINDYKLLNNGKKNIMYAPTFRKSGRSYFEEIKNNIDYKKYNLIIKKHSGEELIYIDNKLVYENYDKYSIKLLTIIDVLITDYSSITFDAMVLNKNIIYYIPDYSLYKSERGVYDEVFKTSKNNYETVEELFKNIENINLENYNKIKKKHIDAKIDLIDFIKQVLKGEV